MALLYLADWLANFLVETFDGRVFYLAGTLYIWPVICAYDLPASLRQKKNRMDLMLYFLEQVGPTVYGKGGPAGGRGGIPWQPGGPRGPQP